MRDRFGSDASSLFQGDVSVHRDAFSTRKGLAIAKKCATLLNGTVSICFEETEVVATLTFTYSILSASICLPSSTLIASVDDQAMIRTMDAWMMQQIGIDVESVQHIRGGTADEIRDFPEYVMQMQRQPSIVLIDQNLDHPIHRGTMIKGTELIPRLRRLGFKGKIVVKSANSAASDIRSFIAAGADGCVAKGLNHMDMSRQLACILFGLTDNRPEEFFDPRVIDTIPIEQRREFVDMFVSEVRAQRKKNWAPEKTFRTSTSFQRSRLQSSPLCLQTLLMLNPKTARLRERCGLGRSGSEPVRSGQRRRRLWRQTWKTAAAPVPRKTLKSTPLR